MENKTLRNILIVLAIVALIGCIIWIVLTMMAGEVVNDVVDDAKLSAAKSETSFAVSGINNWCAAAAMRAQFDDTINICEDGATVEETKNMIDIGDNFEILDVTFENSKVTYLKVNSNKITIEYNGKTYEMVK